MSSTFKVAGNREDSDLKPRDWDPAKEEREERERRGKCRRLKGRR